MIRKSYLLSRIEQLETNVNNLREDLRIARTQNRGLRFVLNELALNSGWRVKYREEGFYLTPLPKEKSDNE